MPNSDELYHYKYLKKYKSKTGKWVYVYNKAKSSTNNKPNESKRSNSEIGFDMEITNKAFDQTKEKMEKAGTEYDKAVKKLHEAYSSNDGKTIGFWADVRDKKLKDLKTAESEHEKISNKLKELISEYEQNNHINNHMTRWQQ